MLFQRRKLEGVAEKPEEVFSVIYLFPLSHVHYNFLSEYHRVVVIFNLLPVNYASLEQTKMVNSLCQLE